MAIGGKRLAKSFGFTPGDFKLEDFNGDGKYTLEDKQFLGHQNPKLSLTLEMNLKFIKIWIFHLLYMPD